MTYFIGGIDTNIGKTISTGLIARSLLLKNKNVKTMKVIQTGSTKPAEDIVMHRSIMKTDILSDDLSGSSCPYTFSTPCSPHLASIIEETPISIKKIIQHCRFQKNACDILLIEGAGGLLVPITQEIMLLDLVKNQNWPLILVTTPRLGSINHTLLSIEACNSRKIPVAGIVFNEWLHTDNFITIDTLNLFSRLHDYKGNIIPLVAISDINQQYDFSDFFKEQ